MPRVARSRRKVAAVHPPRPERPVKVELQQRTSQAVPASPQEVLAARRVPSLSPGAAASVARAKQRVARAKQRAVRAKQRAARAKRAVPPLPAGLATAPAQFSPGAHLLRLTRSKAATRMLPAVVAMRGAPVLQPMGAASVPAAAQILAETPHRAAAPAALWAQAAVATISRTSSQRCLNLSR